MLKNLIPLTALLALCTAPTLAQFGTGNLGQQTRRGMEQAMNDLYDSNLEVPSVVSLRENVGNEKVDAFLEGSVVRLTFAPDGSFTAAALEGGEVVSFKLGKKQFAPGTEEDFEDGWIVRSGEMVTPKRPQTLEIAIKAGPNEVTVECHNKFQRNEQAVTYYVGPLDGLFCIGLTEVDLVAEEDEVS